MARLLLFSTVMASPVLSGCMAIPEVLYEPQYHNPFPQLYRVAVLPFFNLSDHPYVNQRAVAEAYFIELQQIRGFEVTPLGVVEQKLADWNITLDAQTDYQELARRLNVDVVIRGAVTEFSPYYPPRMGLATDWFAANPGFHPIPPGYGLPWGTPDEEFIPDTLVHEAEFALAREQLKTQTPQLPPHEIPAEIPGDPPAGPLDVLPIPPGQPPASQTSLNGNLPPNAQQNALLRARANEPGEVAKVAPPLARTQMCEQPVGPNPPGTDLPPDWPDPRGFIPPPPSPVRPLLCPQPEPIINHVRLYDGHSMEFTEKLAAYYSFRDDARFGGWQAYLQRTEDFIRFCCYLHITETLAARGGVGETRVLWRWPIDRYEP